MVRRFLPFVVMATAMCLTGCGGSGNGLINVPNPRVRFVNAFPNIPTAKVKVGDDTIGGASGIAFGTASDYVVTDNGNKDLTAGDSTFSNLASLNDQLFETEKRYTGIGYGTAGNRTILLLTEDKDQAPSDSVSLQVVNVGSAAVDVYVTDSAAGDTLPASPNFANTGVGVTTSFADLAAPSGPFSARIRVFAVGQTSNALVDTTVVLDSRERAAIVPFADPAAGTGWRVLVLKENT